jgi:hypothetical protein
LYAGHVFVFIGRCAVIWLINSSNYDE